MIDEIERLPSAEEVKDQLEAIEAHAETLRVELNARMQAAKAGVIAELKSTIAEYGIEASELFSVAKAERKTRKTRKTSTNRAIYRDLNVGKEYKGGRFPAWLADRLAATGMAYEAYRDIHMRRAN